MNKTDTTFRRAPLAVLLTGIFLIVLDFFVVNVALPSVQQDLDADSTALQWLVAGYALTFGGLLLVASRIADRWGRRRERQAQRQRRGLRSADWRNHRPGVRELRGSARGPALIHES